MAYPLEPFRSGLHTKIRSCGLPGTKPLYPIIVSVIKLSNRLIFMVNMYKFPDLNKKLDNSDKLFGFYLELTFTTKIGS